MPKINPAISLEQRKAQVEKRKAERDARRRSLPPLDPAQRYSIEESIDYLRSSRASVFADIRTGALRVIRERKRVFIPGTEIVRRSKLPAPSPSVAA